MGFLSKILGLLNGKKTAIGAALMLVGQLVPEVADVSAKVPAIIEVVSTQGGSIVASIGLIHKAFKALKGK